MSEDTTRNLPSSFEERVLSEFAALNARMGSMETRMDSMETRMGSMESRMGSMESRLTSLENKVEARLRETRPIWESVQAHMKEVEKQLDILNRQFKRFIQDLFELRARVERLEDSQPTG
jgi:chromosome segregation ATPase